MAVVYVQILSFLVPPFVIVELFTRDKVLLSAVNVGNPLFVSVTSTVIRVLTGKGPMYAGNVGGVFFATVISIILTQFILQQRHLNAVSMQNI